MQFVHNPWQILIIQATLLIVIGLVDLFALGLPPIDQTSMPAVFPLIFPIVIGAIFLFVLPLLKAGEKKWVWMTLLLTILMLLVAVIISVAEPMRSLAMLFVISLNLISAVPYIIYLRKHSIV
jgi:hypothetical protein